MNTLHRPNVAPGPILKSTGHHPRPKAVILTLSVVEWTKDLHQLLSLHLLLHLLMLLHAPPTSELSS